MLYQRSSGLLVINVDPDQTSGAGLSGLTMFAKASLFEYYSVKAAI